MVVGMEITEATIEEVHWRTGLSRARLRELGSVVPAALEPEETAALDVTCSVLSSITL